MRVQLGKALIAAAVGVGTFSGSAAAQSVDWATCGTSPAPCSPSSTACCTETAANLFGGRASTPSTSAVSADAGIIIALDRCHQRLVNSGTMDIPGTNAANAAAFPRWCRDPSPASTEGMFHAYGLIYRLMQMSIPVYWIVNPTKTASGAGDYATSVTDQVYYETDIDMWIMHSTQATTDIPTVASSSALTACTGACTGPVSLLGTNLQATATYGYKEFPLRGSAFLIPGTDTDADGTTDRAEFNSFYQSYGDGSPASTKNCGPSNDCYDFTAVSLYELNSTAKPMWRNFSAGTKLDGIPVAIKLNYQPPRIARVKSGGNVSAQWLQSANIEDDASSACTQGIFVRSTVVAGMPYGPVVCDVSETDLYNNSLVTGNFGWAWFDGGSNFSSCERALQYTSVFLTSIPGIYANGNMMVNDSRLSEFEECDNNQPLGRQGAAASAVTFGNAIDEKNDQPFMVRYPTNLFSQYGDIPMKFSASSVGHFETTTTSGYNTLFSTAGPATVGTAESGTQCRNGLDDDSDGTADDGCPVTSTLKRLLTREKAPSVGNVICGDNDADSDLTGPGGTPDSGDLPHAYDTWPNANASGCDKDPASVANADFEDVATYGRYKNNLLNGIVFYLPGNSLNGSNVRGELRMVLNALIATPTASVTTSSTTYEVSRASPVVPLINSVEYIVQGTYLTSSAGVPPIPSVPGTTPKAVVAGNSDVTDWYFPQRIGHLRVKETGSATVLFDAACDPTTSPPVSTLTGYTACATLSGVKQGVPQSGRLIFTNTAGGDLRASGELCTDNIGNCVAFSSSISSTMKSLMTVGASLSTATIDAMIAKVSQGYPDGSGGYFSMLGGIDRSTVAVIQASDVTKDGAGRPLMIYVGAADGMMHAFCAETNATYGCTQGRELWAFLPRKMLPFVRLNQARIDGSPRVLDAYIDPDGSGPKTTDWRTVLVFQTGMGDYTLAGREPAVYALDITDPSVPRVLWEYSETAPGTSSLGVGLTSSAGASTVSGVTKYLAWTDTNNLGTSGPGTVITAIDLASGAKHRQAYFQFNPNPRTSSNDPVARSGIPAGTVPLDLPSGLAAKVTHIMFNDIYGRTWLVDPDTLVSVNGSTTPMFTMSADYYAMGPKPGVFTPAAGGKQYAVFTTGGYSDPSNTTWPLACCSSANGTSCDVSQPDPPKVCALYNNSTQIFPTQMFVAVEIDKTATSSKTVPGSECDNVTTGGAAAVLPSCTDTAFLFRRNLGRDEKGTSQVLVVGTDLFLTTESDNINRAGYGTTTGSTGHLYSFASDGSANAASTAIVLGSGGAAAGNAYVSGARAVYAGGASGSFGTGSTTTTGSNVTSKAASGVSRKVWLRTE